MEHVDHADEQLAALPCRDCGAKTELGEPVYVEVESGDDEGRWVEAVRVECVACHAKEQE